MLLPFALPVVFFVWLVPVAQGSVGPPILFYDNQTGPANFFWSLFNISHDGVVVVDNPREEEVFSFNGNGSHDVTTKGNYSKRVTNVMRIEDGIQFLLNGVTEDDAGNYTCREGHETTAIIPNCGQILYFLDGRSVALMRDGDISKQVEEGESLTLICVVNVSALPIPKITWTFRPSDSNPPLRTKPEKGVKLSLGPLARDDSGQYTCQAGSDKDFDGGQSSIELTVIERPNQGDDTATTTSGNAERPNQGDHTATTTSGNAEQSSPGEDLEKTTRDDGKDPEDEKPSISKAVGIGVGVGVSAVLVIIVVAAAVCKRDYLQRICCRRVQQPPPVYYAPEEEQAFIVPGNGQQPPPVDAPEEEQAFNVPGNGQQPPPVDAPEEEQAFNVPGNGEQPAEQETVQ